MFGYSFPTPNWYRRDNKRRKKKRRKEMKRGDEMNEDNIDVLEISCIRTIIKQVRV